MSYDVQLYKRETKIREQQYTGEDFFDHESNLEPFSQLEKQELHDRLLRYGYSVSGESDLHKDIEYDHQEGGVSVLLTDRGLYFSTNGDVFEVLMTASEFTDNDAFVKYDPQHGGWEEIL